MSLALQNITEDFTKSSYLSRVYTAEDDTGKKYILKRGRSPATPEQYQFMHWLKEHPHPCLMIPLEINGEAGSLLEEIYSHVSRPRLDRALCTPAGKEWKFAQIWEDIKELTFALEHIHSQGYLHQDVRPPNIFVNPITLETMLFDYNSVSRPYFLAKGSDSWNDIPPECRTGNTPIDYRFDIYQVGRIFKAMTHRYDHDSREDVLAVRDTPLRALDVMNKASALDREERYKNALEMHEALQQLR